jgi:RHS repeat-associated protein
LNYIRHTDWLGSSRLATTWAHAVYSKEAYAPFGETYNEAGTPDSSFTRQDQDVVTGSAGTGTYDFLFRKYDPAAGRWLSPDPSGWGAVDQTTPQSLNRYAYVQNNPMSMIDPEGLDCFYITGTGVSASGSDSAQSCAYNGGTWYQGTQTYLPTTDVYGNSMFTAVIPGYGDNSDNLIIGVTQLGGTGCNMGDALCQQLYGELTVSGNQNNAATNAPSNGAKNKATKKSPFCWGTFGFSGAEVDGVEGGGFAGAIVESNSATGYSAGSLVEGWIGGEGPVAGVGKITSSSDTSVLQGLLGFVGAGVNAGPLAGAQVGYAAGYGWGGLYIEGHLGTWALGTGAYLGTACN